MLSVIRKECLTFKTQCDEIKKQCDVLDQPSLIHCRLRADKICISLDELDADTAVSLEEQIDILKAFVFVILDYTFYVESDMAEKSFAIDDPKSAILRIMQDIDKPRMIYDSHIAASATENVSAKDDTPADSTATTIADRSFDEAVGDDLAECLYWRKGALIYMFHSATEARLPNEPNKAELAHLLECGVDNLKKMLSVRQEFKVIDNDAFVHDDGNTLQLIQRGLFSDTHVLALMYAGEMCYWLDKWIYPDPSCSSFSVESPFHSLSFRSVGVELLTRYKEAVGGPLKSAGWSCEKAQEILDYFQS